jgi:hypothetical protein
VITIPMELFIVLLFLSGVGIGHIADLIEANDR